MAPGNKNAHLFSAVKAVSGPIVQEKFQNAPKDFSNNRYLDEADFIERVRLSQGSFNGVVQWCSNLQLNDWKTNQLKIDEKGKLGHAVNESDRRSLQNTVVEDVTDSVATASSSHPIVSHLQNCEIRLIHESSGDFVSSIIEVQTSSNVIYLRASSKPVFFDLFCSLTFWKSLKSNDVFNKTNVIQPIFHKPLDPTNVILCQCHVFGPIPKNKHVQLSGDLAKPPNDDSDDYGWFVAMGVLKSDGILDFLLQSDGSLIYSIDITKLLRSEILIVDSSIFQSDKYLFMGILPHLRKQLQISSNETCLVDNPRSSMKNKKLPQHLYVRLPLRIDLEDWFVALNSFAMPDVLSLIGTDKSNELRISNRFKISILEADLRDLEIDSTHLYSEINIWGQTVARTAIVHGSRSPFWREEFDFNFSVKTNIIKIIIKRSADESYYSIRDSIIGEIQITQEMVNDPNLNKETRLPVFSYINKNFQIGTICIKIISCLNFVLQPVNFTKFEQVLSKVSLPKICDYMQINKISTDLRLEDISLVFLDIFQAINREDDWFQALIDREFEGFDKSITMNNSNNQSLTHIYNTLFRGNSILTKTMETYCYRVGEEYLDKCIGTLIRQLIDEDESYEIDPNRIKESDPEEKQKIIEVHFQRLLSLAEKTWQLIFSTSNDLPQGIKSQLKCFRKKLEILEPDKSMSLKSLLNCISGFLFLRFLCPVILNPKIFNFVDNHPSENSRRTLTLLAKILMNLSTLTQFGAKEPWMVKMNSFVNDHEEELLDYLDKITEKKLDFTPKRLKLSSSLTRPKLELNQEILKHLPANPFLIDKYLRETELINVFATSKENEPLQNIKSVSMEQMYKVVQEGPAESGEFSIGGLEFEKMSENNTEVFGDDLLNMLKNEDEGDKKAEYQPSDNDNLMYQLEQESALLFNKIKFLVKVLDDYEYPNEIILGKAEYASFLANSLYYDKEKNVYLDFQNLFAVKDGYTKLFKSTLTAEKFFFFPESKDQYSQTGSVDETGNKTSKFSVFGKTSSDSNKKPEGRFARWFKKS
ncbi:unnamed protein product [Kluyveromyces dobzhanskii CBS 2104]|uniref:WGS project CCBQ000000000 data, contig 00016 n=1 Tax=Kluyveromyces dobzhanskii CBS 2104 TaxID=1427455 RepID=A0A0A8L0C6_9SACH|nr:unnamed protein product [Kluyveromyces dobzhanskii CBS 2104]